MLKRIKIILILVIIFVVVGMTQTTFGEAKNSSSTISFKAPVTVKQKIIKAINDTKIQTRTIKIKFLDTKGNEVQPEKEIRLRQGTHYDLTR